MAFVKQLGRGLTASVKSGWKSVYTIWRLVPRGRLVLAATADTVLAIMGYTPATFLGVIACWICLVGTLSVLAGLHLALTDGHNAAEADATSDPITVVQGRDEARRNGSDLPNTRTEYEVATAMMRYESNHFWTVFTAFLVGQTLLATLLVDQLRDNGHPGIAYGMLATGAALCLPWYTILERARLYVTLRIFQARELEHPLGFSIMRAGGKFAENQAISFAEPAKNVQLKGAAASFGIRQTTQIVPWVFLALFGFLGWQLSIREMPVDPHHGARPCHAETPAVAPSCLVPDSE